MARTQLYPPSVDPGFPELLETPKGWTRTTFGDALTVIERPAKLAPESSYQLVTAKRNRVGIVSRGFLLGSEVLTKTQFVVREGDFLISRRQIIHGACGVVPAELDNAVVSNEYSTLRTRPPLLMDFFRQYSHTQYFQRTCFHSSHGVDVEKMIFKIDQWLKFPVDIPPISEQSKIASILASLDNAIESTEALINQLGVVKKALMAELLTRGIPGRHTKFKQTEIGELPGGWEVMPLSNTAFVQTGIAKGKPIVAGIELPYLRVANVQDGHVVLSEVKTITVDREAVARYSLQPGDVLFTEGGDADKLGRGCVWKGQIKLCLHQNHVFAVRTEPSRLLPEYLSYWAASPRGKSYFLDCAKQTTNLASINSTQLKAFPIAIPPISEQAEIVSAIGSVESRLIAERSIYESMLSFKAALMSALLTGELRVTPDEQPA